MKEQLEKEIQLQKQRIKQEESINVDSENLSFLYWQLHELERELQDEYDNKRI